MNIRIKNIFKNSFKLILFFIICYFLLLFELPYYIKRGGGVIDISKRINIESSSEITGSYNMAYVSELRATIPIYIIAKMNKNWDIIDKNEEVEGESDTDSNIRGEVALNEANQTATIIAYKKASKKVNIKETKVIVTYIDSIAKTDLKVGDIILEVNDINIDKKEDFNNIISNLNIGDKVNIKVKNNDKYYTKSAEVIEYENRKIIGIIAYQNYDLEVEPKIKFDFNKSESGSSGGLMMTLAIYDYLTDSDLAKGRKIAGTGTIDINGTVGEIDGVKYKLKGAVNDNANIFFVPKGDNYDEALKYLNDNNYDIELVPVATLDDAINYLKQ